jgi:hypothetical protein
MEYSFRGRNLGDIAGDSLTSQIEVKLKVLLFRAVGIVLVMQLVQ